ncbi:glutathione S-transferase II [Hypoxylon sp. NC1633]|nr:glutathione S-transferase II [Hypoxylon sp. NC1633]
MSQPIRVWLTPPGPNSWKVIVILEELQVPYEIVSFRFEDVKKKPFIDINPNGRVPAIVDPNHDITLWESGAILTYLIENYNPKRLLTYDNLREKHHLNQWLHFQMSGQGPYWGTAGHFNVLHSLKLPTAIERCNEQVTRVLGVLEGWLEGKEWLVGDKITYADLAWLPWNDRLESVLLCPADTKFAGFPNVQAWHERMASRPSWKKSMEIRARLMDEQGLEWNGMPKGINNLKEYEDKMAADEAAAAGK